MEEWQKEFITKNLPELITNIKCDVVFLAYLGSYGALSQREMNRLKAIQGVEDEKASDLLIGILQTKDGGYKHLAMALKECVQTGAFAILLKGIKQNAVSRDVLFGGVRLPLGHLCNPIGAESLQIIVKDNLDSTNYERFLSEEAVTVAIDTVPDPLNYYVPRTLSINTQLDPNIFDELVKDILCVEGIELYKLSSLSGIKGNNTSDRSRNQIHEVTARFILLEHHDHFQEIVNKTKKTVHWIKCNNNDFFYVKASTGSGIQAIQKYLASSSPQHFSEDEFLERCQNIPSNAPILLYDSPGMGKSILMANLARKSKASQPTSSVAYFEISQLISKVRQFGQVCSSVAIKQALVESITTNKFGINILHTLFNTTNHQIKLFLDAFDEVSGNDLDSAHKILDCIVKDCKNIQMFISTRPHRRNELESKFGVLGYNILPFDNSNKLSFFQNYWQNMHCVMITKGIKEFAEHCIHTISSEMSSDGSDIAGIPLQCRMLADIYSEGAKKGGLFPTESHYELNSIFKVYKVFIDTKFATSCNDAHKHLYYKYHVRESLRLLFPTIYEEVANEPIVVEYESIYRIGLLEPSKSDSKHPMFLHRTLAECFAAEFLATSATSKFPREVFSVPFIFMFIQHAMLPFSKRYLLGNVEWNFQHPVICRFLDFFLSSLHSYGQDIATLKNVFRESAHYTADELFKLFECSLNSNTVHLSWYLLDLNLDLDPSSEKNISLLKFKHSLRETQHWEMRETRKLELVKDLKKKANFQQLVATAVRYSSLSSVKLSCAFLESVTGKSVSEFQYNNYNSPMYCALERGHYQIFEYILNFDRERFYEKPLLHWCLAKTYGRSVGDRLQIVKRILDERPDLLTKLHPSYGHVPLLEDKVHFSLTKILIEEGADLTQTNSLKQNIAHKTATCFTAEEYHEFVEIIISRNAQIIFQQRDKEGLTPLHWGLMRTDLKSGTLEVLAYKCSVNFNDNFPLIGSELAVAIEFERSERVIQDIIRLGGDMGKLHRLK